MKSFMSGVVQKFSKNILIICIAFSLFSAPVPTHAAALSSVVSAIVNIVTTVLTVVVGTVVSTIGGVFGDPSLGCQWVGTNGWATIFNGGCGEGQVAATIAPGNFIVHFCTNGNQVTTLDNADPCVLCPDGAQTSGSLATCVPTACVSFGGVCTPNPAPIVPRPSAAPTRINGGGGGCFVAGTKVILGDGTSKNIESVVDGDTLKTSSKPERVSIKYVIPYKGFLYAFNGDGHYFVTPTHPFMTKEGWKSLDPDGTRKESPGIVVSKLAVGDTLILEGGTTKKLEKLDAEATSTTVYNFGISGTHDFYADNYLVHNVNLGLVDHAQALVMQQLK